MNQEVLYLVGIFFVGCVAIIFRSISFNLAGERFVARLRKKVTIEFKLQFMYYVLLLALYCNNQPGNGIL